jgi:murein DD-endopeptidase MepM/ murein hydrolase activator NlpD
MRTLAAFILGIAVGVLCLGVVLWRNGSIDPAHTFARATTTADSAAPPHAHVNALPDVDAGRKYVPTGQTPALPPAPEPVPHKAALPATLNTADRASADRVVSDEVPPPDLFEKHLTMPVQGYDASKLVDTFTQSRSGARKHEALDIMAARGTPVVAVDEGNVVKLFNSKQGGLTVYQFDNSRTWCYYYAHLDRYSEGLKEGMLLRRGEVLGYVGSTGDASADAPHLHFAIFRLGPEKRWWEGTPIDPFALFKTGS